MPEVDKSIFGIHDRRDGPGGHIEVTPTTMGYVEEDGSDIRVERVRVFNEQGELEKVYLRDKMGVRFANLSDVADDLDYLEKRPSDV